MNIKLFIAFALLCLPILSKAQFQSYTEIGVIGAFTNYSGDIAESRVEFGETKVGLGAFARWTFAEKFALKGQGYFGQISGDDVNASSPANIARKFRFQSVLIEGSAVAEFSFISNEHSQAGRMHGSPYFFAGLGLAYANPEPSYYGPDSTDPDKNPFPEPTPVKNIFFSIPIGFGGKIYLDERLSASAEFGWRPVFSDKLDGISLSGNPNKKDWYIVMGLGLSYVLPK